ncbi:MAG: DUF58 domain-containing protein [Planctomycetes bacterium]|nr:DUF58 domain-containing protein [Planctomycetota bacterium]MCC7062896.1 DUF58 domain-containing protein [Planctomycetota bacterium]
MLRPTRRTLLIAGFGAPVAALPTILGTGLWPLWVGYVLALALGIAIEIALIPSRRSVQVTASPPGAMEIGSESALPVEVVGPARLQMLEVVPHLWGVTPAVPALSVKAQDGKATVQFTLAPMRRGPTVLGSIWVRWQGPLGLLWNEAVHAQQRTIDTLPDTRHVRAHALRLRARPEDRAGLKVEQFLGDGSEFDALREFVVGFDRRSVDWKASARHRELLCRQYRAERNHQVILAVDTGNRMGECIDGIPRVDHAIRTALQLAFTCLKTGDLVGAYGFDDQPRVLRQPQAGLKVMAGLQTALGDLDYSTAESNYTLALTHLLSQVQRRSLVVLFTDFVDSITAELMVPNVLRLAKRHRVLFVALRDTTVAKAIEIAPQTLHHVHSAVIAGEMAREREIVLERIRRAGAHVVDAAPNEISAQLIDSYLQLKRREAV